MGIFGKKKIEEQKPVSTPAVSTEVVTDKKVAVVKIDKKVDKKIDKKVAKPSVHKLTIKGTSAKAYDVLLKPLITEKASELNALNKYAFAINPRMNKIEVKKAIRKIYEVDPVAVNILNFSGKQIRYGKTAGQTKKWKKAIVTLKAGDTIKVYEGV